MPRNHHYIPQFWLKRFSHDGKSKLVWSYDWESDKIDERSVAMLMAQYDLYTQSTAAGPDVSLETGEMGIVDNQGAELFRRIDNGDRSLELRENMADFFSVMALRHPSTVNRYPSAAAGLILNIQESLEVANQCGDFINYMASLGVPDFSISPAEFAQLKAATPQARDLIFGRLFDSLLATGGDPNMPFSDVITDQSGREILKKRLLNMKWVLRRSKGADLVIGDTGIVFERGESDLGWKIVLSPDLALLITKSDWPVPSLIEDGTFESWEVSSINVETAARSRRLLVGGSKSAVAAIAQHLRGG